MANNGYFASSHPAYFNGKLKCDCGELLDTFDGFYEHIKQHHNYQLAYDLLPAQQFKRLLHDDILRFTKQDLTKTQIEVIINAALEDKTTPEANLNAKLFQIMVIMGIDKAMIGLIR